MNVTIKHGSTTITSRVISYTREHNICTSIGKLDVTLERTYSTAIEPFDTFDIHENGSFKVRYYVSDVEDIVPDGIIVVHCQDKSKYLTDYFIPDSYTIDYPTYTREWIEKFLDEAGVNYNFTTSSQGNLISNDTSLGLQPAYDQILMLLQLSGWYMYFDGNGVAIIGSLDTDLASSAGSLGKTDVLEIKKISNDKMLRNRAVVWGQYDPLNKEYAYADVSRHTRWNYGHNDLRTMVVSNSNIPNKSSAYNIANILLKEFSTITVEKHITAWGARNFNLGEMVRVNTNIWRGKGMITTFGVSMDRSGGLVTNLILDERCPRLFGFFNFGDYVYVSTFGDGIWRKHIRFDPAWYNFSTGLLDLNITDLHINNGVFGAVGHSGAMYYANNEEGPWNSITLQSLESSVEATVSGQDIQYQPFSGIMARAVIVDKITNNVKFAVDTWSGVNTGDYFLTLDIIGSGGSNEKRSWIVEYDPYIGQLTGGIGSGIYPVNHSGNYNFTALDLENDGVNDYISVKAGTSSGIFIADGYDLGRYSNAPVVDTFDNRAVVASPFNPDLDSNRRHTFSPRLRNNNCMAMFDDAVNGNRSIVYVEYSSVTPSSRRIVKRTYSLSGGSVTSSIVSNTSAPFNGGAANSPYLMCIHKVLFAIDTYRVFYVTSFGVDPNIYYVDWDVTTNTVSSATVALDLTTQLASEGNRDIYTVSVGGILYFMYKTTQAPQMFGGDNNDPQILKIYLAQIDQDSASVLSNDLIYTYTTEKISDGPPELYEFFPPPGHLIGNDSAPNNYTSFIKLAIFQNGESGIKILGWFEHGYPNVGWTEHLLVGNQIGIQSDTIIKDGGNFRFTLLSPANGSKSQLDRENAILGFDGFSGSHAAWSTNGSVFLVYNGTRPYYLRPNRIYPIYSRSARVYIARDDTPNFFVCDSATLAPLEQLQHPPGYFSFFGHPYSNTNSFTDEVYWQATKESPFSNVVLKAPSAFALSSATPINIGFITTTNTAGINIGGFFVDGFPKLSTNVGASDHDFSVTVTYYYYTGGELEFPSYLVLQRNGSEFNLIQQSSKPIRIDISNNSPALTVLDNEDTFISNFVYEDSLTKIIPVSGLTTQQVNDYRYALLETQAGEMVSSGVAASSQILYVSESGIFTTDVDTYSGGFTYMGISPSGLNRIETSNYTYPGQFIFVTTSGQNPAFYQKDNDKFIFDTYSGLPDSRVTCIRLDDRF